MSIRVVTNLTRVSVLCSHSNVCVYIMRAALQNVVKGLFRFPELCFRSCPPTHPLHEPNIPVHGIARWHGRCNSALCLRLYTLCIERWNEGENDSLALPAMRAICFAECVFWGCRSKRYNFDVGAFIQCRHFLSVWSLFNILGCVKNNLVSSPARTLTAVSNNPHRTRALFTARGVWRGRVQTSTSACQKMP